MSTARAPLSVSAFFPASQDAAYASANSFNVKSSERAIVSRSWRESSIELLAVNWLLPECGREYGDVLSPTQEKRGTDCPFIEQVETGL